MVARVRLTFVPQRGPQHAYVTSPCDITVYGGSRGGGKTFGSLGDFFIHAEEYGADARGLIVRKSREDLKDTIAIGQQMYGNSAKWNEKGSYFRFYNGARLYAAYLEKDKDAEHYQGWNLTRVYIEELTQFGSSGPVMKLLGALRSPKGIKCRMKCTCNPGGPGHGWVKAWVIDLGPYNVTVDPESGLTRVFIPAKIADNPALLHNDPGYVNRLKGTGSPELVRAWLEGDWDVIEGSFFPEFRSDRHVITPFPVPGHWVRFMSGDWGSAKPFSFGWWAVVQDDMLYEGHTLPRGAIIRYREYYGASKPDVGLKLPAEVVAGHIVDRETDHRGMRERISYRVLDPAAFAVVSGPSIGETFARNRVPFRRADNSRKSTDKRMGGWDVVRARLVGNAEGYPMMFFMNTCRAIIRTLPLLQHDPMDPEDCDSDAEDHAPDEVRYACLSRPFFNRTQRAEDKNPYLVSNAFKLNELR